MKRRGKRLTGPPARPRPANDPGQAALAAKLDRALALYQRGALNDALRLYGEAARALPNNHRLWLAVASVVLDLGDLAAAQAGLRRAALLAPNSGVAWVNLSGAALRQDAKPSAEAAARRALITAPGDVTARNNLARSLVGVDRSESLAHAYRRAAIIAPSDSTALMTPQLWASEVARADLVIRAARHALCAHPSDALSASNLGAALVQREDRPAASLAYKRALTADPACAPAWYNLGNFLDHEGANDQAIRALVRATLLSPKMPDYHFNKALVLLRAGRFSEGLKAFEWRWGSMSQLTEWQEPGRRLWDGRSLHGETVLVWAEQGLGDSVQFSRYLRLIRDRGGVPLLQVQPALAPMFQHSPLAEAVYAQEKDTLPAADFHVPMMSLPRLAASTPKDVPDPTPFPDLPPPAAIERVPGRINVGLVWAGNTNHRQDAERSIPLNALAGLTKLPSVQLHVLQHDDPGDQIATCGFTDGLVQYPTTPDILDAVAMIRAMDLVITVDTAYAHLAATLGVRTWILVNHVPDWRWLQDRSDSIWYPSVTLYHQDASRTWEPVIAEIAKDLARYRKPK